MALKLPEWPILTTLPLKDRINGLKAIRDQATADAERAQATLDSSSNQSITPDTVKTFARAAREWLRLRDGGYRRDHLRALAQRIEVGDNEVRMMGTKAGLLQTLVAASSQKASANEQAGLELKLKGN